MDPDGQKEKHMKKFRATSRIGRISMGLARSDKHLGGGKLKNAQQAVAVGRGEHQVASKLHMKPPRSKEGIGKGQSTGGLQEGHQIAAEVVMEPPSSKNKKRKKATAEMCTNPPAPVLGTLMVDKDKQTPLSKHKRPNTPSIRANGKVALPTRSALCRRRICCPCRKRGSDILLSADASIALSSARSGPMLARAEPVTPLRCLRSPRTKTEAGQLKLNLDSSCKGESRSRGADQHQGAGKLHMEPSRSKKRNGKGQSAGELREAHQVTDEVVVEPPRSKNKKRKKQCAIIHLHRRSELWRLIDKKPPLSKKKKFKSTPSIRANGKVMSSASRLCKQQGSVNMFKKPKAVRLKLNFDGSSKYDESRRASIGAFGGVFRDPEGRFVLGYAGRIGNATSSVAELVALKRCLELALQIGWRDISIEGDCKAAIEAIRNRVRVRASKDREQFRAITAMLPRLGKVSVTHVGRKRNTVADRFAELGHKAPAAQRVWRDVPPEEVLLHLRRDAESRMRIKLKRKMVK